MRDWLRLWRERGWTPIEPADYATAWQRFGGSVATHPQIIERLSQLAGIRTRYLGWFAGDELMGAIATWGGHLALSKKVLKQRGQRGLFDLDNTDIIPPPTP